MSIEHVWLGDAESWISGPPGDLEYEEIDGERYLSISGVDRIPPFFMSVPGDGDMWLFVGSNGAFTAGRVDPDSALFPYQTVDKILENPASSRPISLFLVQRAGRRQLWEPWQEGPSPYRIQRNLAKHVYGHTMVFEETNEDLGLRIRWSLSACERYGLVRECRLENLSNEAAEVRYLDGWQHLLPPGVTQETWGRYSYLVTGYMRHELADRIPLATFTLNAAMSDRPEPSESLRAAAAWSLGHTNPTFLISTRQVDAFRRGEQVELEREVRGEIGALLAAAQVAIPSGGAHTWMHVADTGLGPAAVLLLRNEVRDHGTDELVAEALSASHEHLKQLIAGADGIQETGDPVAGSHHFANVLYNCMRGGTFDSGHMAFPRSDLAAFLKTRNRAVATQHAKWLANLPEMMAFPDLHKIADSVQDPALRRLLREYLPLTFSRRHGDPSRPWNLFAIHIKDKAGRPVYGYQGNWRDIFQNWEALAQSFPAALESMVTVFLNASTADGYNPYRITRDGVDWEVAEPGNPWSHIGYWGDHQIVYLLRLLESWERFEPGSLASRFRQAGYSYANVPYEIHGFDALLADPRHSITFRHDRHAEMVERARKIGSDARLLAESDGNVRLATLAEKLLIPALSKLTNLVPEGGIWLNTQRPEWNDANNALAGWGLSVVTVHYLRRYLVFLNELIEGAGGEPVSIAAPVARLLDRVTSALGEIGSQLPAGFDDAARFRALEALGRAGEEYREQLYSSGLGDRQEIPVSTIRDLVDAALPVLDQTLQANRRADGLFHSYNVLSVAQGRATVKHLSLMLEGQVAALSSGILSPSESAALLKSLRASALYREDQKSYLLYPDRELPSYLERNKLPDDCVKRAPILADLASAGNISLAERDSRGAWHFQPDLRNAADLAARIDALAEDPKWQELARRDRAALLDLWEEVFRHSEFTGRSGTFFMFEGLGSIYWHMVAKLLVAVQECWCASRSTEPDSETTAELASAYAEIRDGLGFRKTPAEYGAFPTDPYSHSPRHRGAQQPGMTGQVKEEILTRWGELGVQVEQGVVRFRPSRILLDEFQSVPWTFRYVDLDGRDAAWDLPAGSLAFTYCQVPVCCIRADSASIRVEWSDGSVEERDGNTLTREESAGLFSRQGALERVTVMVVR